MGALSELTDKQERFIVAYLGPANLNATEAARIAGYSDNGDSALRVEGHRALTNANIRARIQRELAARQMPVTEVLTRLSDHARASIDDIGDIDDETGEFKINLKRAKERGKLHTIHTIEYHGSNKFRGPGEVKSVKMRDSLDALDKLARVHKLFGEELPAPVQQDVKIINVILDSLPPDIAGAVRRKLGAITGGAVPTASDSGGGEVIEG